MPDYEVSIRYTLEYTAVKSIKAKDENTAHERVSSALEQINGLKSFEAYIGPDSDIDMEETLEIEDVSEA